MVVQTPDTRHQAENVESRVTRDSVTVTPGVMMEDAHLEMSPAQPPPGWPRTGDPRTPVYHCKLNTEQHK